MQKVIRPDNISFLQKCQINAGDSMSTIKLLVTFFSKLQFGRDLGKGLAFAYASSLPCFRLTWNESGKNT